MDNIFPIPNAGIDKIKIILSPLFINPIYRGHKNYIDPLNRITLHHEGIFTLLAIHIEYMDLLDDCRFTMARAIHELIQKGVIMFPDIPIPGVYFLLNYFVLGISELEFYFDLMRKKVTVSQEAVENGNLIQYKSKDTDEGQYSFYSKDYKTKRAIDKRDNKSKRKVVVNSKVHIYDKKEKNLHDRHIKRDILENYPFDIRLEFVLCRNNCDYLSMTNLKGNYFTVFKRYLPLLSVIYNNYIKGNIKVKGKDNKQFSKIIRKSKNGKTRYTENKLIETETIPGWVMSGTRDYKNVLKYRILEQFLKTTSIDCNDDSTSKNDDSIMELVNLSLDN